MEDRTCKTCRHNDDLLCDKKGIWIRDDYSCSKWEVEPWQQWRKLHDLGFGFQCGTIFQELEKPFRGKGGCCK